MLQDEGFKIFYPHLPHVIRTSNETIIFFTYMRIA